MKLQKEDHVYYLVDSKDTIATTDSNFHNDGTVMKLSKENCDSLFENFSIEEIALSKASYFGGTYRNPEGFSDEQIGYLHGFIEGAELNKDKLFTLEDMEAIFAFGHQVGMNTILAIQSQHSPQPSPKPDSDKLRDKVIQSLQQPKEIDVEIKMNLDSPCPNCGEEENIHGNYDMSVLDRPLINSLCNECGEYFNPTPKLDKNNCLILKKK
jgi:hypothetical protein